MPVCQYLWRPGAGRGHRVDVRTCAERPSCSCLWLKTKGRSHCTPVARPQAQTQHGKLIEDLVLPHLTEQRMQQGLAFMRDVGHDLVLSNTPRFCGWVTDNLLKDERDVLLGAGLKEHDIRKAASGVPCRWFKERVFA